MCLIQALPDIATAQFVQSGADQPKINNHQPIDKNQPPNFYPKVVTSTVLSTQSVLVAESQKASPTRSLRQLQLLQAILGLRRA